MLGRTTLHGVAALAAAAAALAYAAFAAAAAVAAASEGAGLGACMGRDGGRRPSERATGTRVRGASWLGVGVGVGLG